MEYQTCKICGEKKELTTDNFSQGKNKRNGVELTYWFKKCKLCDRERCLKKSSTYKSKNRKSIAKKQNSYYCTHKKQYSEYQRQWYQDNKEQVLQRVKKNIRKRRETDILFILKERISRGVSEAIQKKRRSVVKYLPYSIQELKDHLESLFEPWMTWDNYGVYRVDSWNDSDPSTWIWQIDHIVPHSKFKYSSMEDQEFKDCWALTNLRPYSAKQNVIDGDRNVDVR
jgi:hypothetical protein